MTVPKAKAFDPKKFSACLETLHGQAPDFIETHISWVYLLPTMAYKVKKPVNLGFLDFSSCSDRRYYCEEELRLNGRFSDLYLDVIPIGDKGQHYTLGEVTEPIEFAVRMRRFPSDSLFLTLLEQGLLEGRHMEALGERIGQFHRSGCHHLSYPSGPSPDDILKHALDNLDGISGLLEASDSAFREALEQIRIWTIETFGQLKSLFSQRHEASVMLEGHGDLHLRNIVLLDEVPTPFDGIEFSVALRTLDPMNEIAFLLMDLEVRGAFGLGAHFLNRYLEESEDYEGLPLLQFYKVYRACVRAKIALIDRSQSSTPKGRTRATKESRHYLDYALGLTLAEIKPVLILLHGYSGSGKTTLAKTLMPELRAIHLRTDQVRKSLEGLAHDEASDPTERGRIYQPEQRDLVYQHMIAWGEAILRSGYSLLLDATFLQRSARDRALEMAQRVGVPPLILSIRCDEETTQKRINDRLNTAQDASEATYEVYLRQKDSEDPLNHEEQAITTVLNSSLPIDGDTLLDTIRSRQSA